MENKDLKNQRRAGFYWLEGKSYVSVTNVLKVLDKPALRYWFGREIYYAMAKDPTLSEAEAMSAPYKKSDRAKDRGATVHSIVEAWKKTGVKISPDLKDFKGYAQAFHKWVRANDIEIVSQEKTVVSEKYGYAGTLDLLIKLNGNQIIVDVKTGKGIYSEAFLQLSAYRQALSELRPIEPVVNGTAVLLLKENGEYQFETGEDLFEVFLSCLKIWEWQNKELLEKMKGSKHGLGKGKEFITTTKALYLIEGKDRKEVAKV